MARIRVLLILIVAIAAGSVFAAGTYNYVQKAAARPAGVPSRPVVVAAADLDLGAAITRNDVRVIDWPANALPANVIGDPSEVIGLGLLMPMIENEPFLPMKLASKEAGAGLPPAIPPGLRAVSVKVNEVIGVAGYVLPGTRVDVVATVSPTQQPTDMTSKVILTNVQVLAAGTRVERDGDRNKPVAVSVVTLLVAPDESERLTLAATEGRIQLALRNPLDKTTPATRGVRPAMLIGAPSTTPRPVSRTAAAKAPPQPAPAPVLPTVEIIRGDKRAREVVQ